jgi:hypothetical protein
MNEEHLREAGDESRERLLRVVRIVLLLSLVPWISSFFRPFERVRVLLQLGACVFAAIVAARYYRGRIVVRVPARFTRSGSVLVRGVANFVVGYGEFLVAFYAFIAILGIFGIIDHFVQ